MPARSRSLSLAAVAALVVVGITCGEPTAPKGGTRPAGIVNPGNTPPVASAGGPYTGVEGAPVAFDASGTTDADLPGDPLLYKWDFDNDGVYDDSSTTPTISHTYPDNGSFTAKLTVVDDGPDSSSTTAAVTVDNAAPVVSAGGDASTTEGQSFTLGGSFTDAGTTDGPWAYTVDWGDGSAATAGNAASQGAVSGLTHVYADEGSGSYTATLTVTDKDGTVSSGSATITATNAAPVVVPTGPTTITTGTLYELSGTATDQGANDGPWAVEYDWGDGTTTTGSLTNLVDGLSASHTFTTDGTHSITVTVTDADGAAGVETTLTIASSLPLVADAGAGYTGTEGSAIAFDGSASNDPDGDPLTLTWDFGDGTPTQTGATPTHTYGDNGTYTVTLTVDDGEGHTNTATASATVSNALPIVNAGADASIDEGQSYTLNASFSDAGTADNPWTYAINWGDGSANTTGSSATQAAISASHLYNTPGSYTVTLTVTDKNSGGSSDDVALTVRAVKPTARAGGPYIGVEGSAVSFNGSTSSDPNSDPLTYAWDFDNNGTTDATTATPTHTYVQNGTYTVKLTVNDGNGHTSTATTNATIDNAVPVVNAGVNATIDERSTFTLNGSFTDAGTTDNPWTTTIAWGEGTPTTGSLAAQGPVTGTHTYNTPGTYTVTLSVKDKDGGTGTASITLTVRAVWPTARTGGPYTGREGGPVAFNGSTSSDPNGDALTYAWDFDNNGTTDATTATPSHTYADNGTYTVKLTVSDGNGHSSSATTTATIGNAAPVVNAGADAGVDETAPSTSFTLNATFSDSGVVDNPWSYTIDWGNGTTTGSKTTQGAITATRAYAASGTYTVKVTVTDKNGGVGTDNLILTVRGLWPTASIGGPYSGREGVPLAFDASGSTDPNGDALTYAWTFGDGTTGTGATPSHTYADNGSYTARLIVTDPAGHADTATAAVTIVASVGVVSAGPDGTVSAGGSFTLNGNFTDGAADGPWTYEIAWGDGTTTFGVADAPGAVTASHRYGSAGSFTVTLTITDKDGGSASDVALVTVTSAAAPVANVNGPYTGTEGKSIVFSSAGSTDPNGEALTYSWSFGDGTTSASANPSKAYTDNGTYTVILKVTSRSGLTASDTTEAVVANVAPTATFSSSPSSVVEGSGYTLSLSGSDAGTVDRATLAYAFDCGQGAGLTGFSSSKTVACPVVPDQRSLTVRGQVQDKDGGLTTYTKTLNVTNAAPVVAWAATTPTTVAPGTSVGFNGSFTDRGVNDATWTYTIIWGDGTPNTTGTTTTPITAATPLSVSHTYTKPGKWLAYMTVKDKDAATGTSAKVTVTVSNNPPVANANGPYAAPEGTAIQFSSLGSSDPEGLALTYAWTFGDGTTSTAANPKKTYADDRTYTVTLTVKDPSGATATSSTTATTTNVAPTATLGVPATTEGTAYTLTVTGTDAGTADRTTLQYDMDCGQGAGWRGWSTTRTHTCPAVPDQRSVTLQYRVKDDELAERSYTQAFTITNAVPVVTFAATTPTSFTVGGSLGVQGSFTDKGVNDNPWTYTIVWGDGTASTTGFASPGTAIVASHPYAKTGTFGVTLSVRDKDGATKVSTKVTVTVSP